MSSMIYGCFWPENSAQPGGAIARLRAYLSRDESYTVSEESGDGFVIGSVQIDDRRRCGRSVDCNTLMAISGNLYGSDGFTSGEPVDIALDSWNRVNDRMDSSIRGPFAAIIVDQVSHRAIAIVDILGLQPLYVTERNGSVFISSEAEAFVSCGIVEPVLDADALAELFAVGFVLGERTLFQGVRRLTSGTLLEIREGRCSFSRRRLSFGKGACGHDLAQRCRDLDDILSDIVWRQIASAGSEEIRLALSGGLDSRLILSYLLRHRANFEAVTYDEPYAGGGHEALAAIQLSEAMNFRHRVIPESPGLVTSHRYILARGKMTITPTFTGRAGEVLRGVVARRVDLTSPGDAAPLVERIFTSTFCRRLTADPGETLLREMDRVDVDDEAKRRLIVYLLNVSSFFRRISPSLHRHGNIFLKNQHIPFLDSNLVDYLTRVPVQEHCSGRLWRKFFERIHPKFCTIATTTRAQRLPAPSVKMRPTTNLDEGQFIEYAKAFRRFSPLWRMHVFTGDFKSDEEWIAACCFNVWHDHYFGFEESEDAMKRMENAWLKSQIS